MRYKYTEFYNFILPECSEDSYNVLYVFKLEVDVAK